MFTWPRSAQSESDEFQHISTILCNITNCMTDYAMDARTADFLNQTVSVLESSQSAYQKHQHPDRQKGETTSQVTWQDRTQYLQSWPTASPVTP